MHVRFHLATTVLPLIAAVSAGLSAAEQPDLADDDLAAIEQRIAAEAEAAQGRCDGDDDDPQVRSRLDDLVESLLAETSERSEAEKLPDLVGGWKQVWSDGPAGAPGCILADDVYQVVFPNGYFYNIGRHLQPDGSEATGYLKGTYEIAPEALRITFTREELRDGWIGAGADLGRAAMRVEAARQGAPQDARQGRPPVGQSGTLANVYVSDDLRIVRGGGEEYDRTFLYVLTRSDDAG